MSERTGDAPRQRFSRREWLRRAGAAMGAAVVGPSPAGTLEAQEATPEAPTALTVEEYETLNAICSRLIPADENGPGAGEAMAARYIDRGLAGALEDALPAYRDGLAALDAHARSSRGAPFRNLPPEAQDRVLEEVQDDQAPGFTGRASQFFNLVRGHTIQGMFSDPFYGGNADFIGWDLIGYPGVRMSVTEDYQQMGVDHVPNHMSAYDFPMFEKGEL